MSDGKETTAHGRRHTGQRTDRRTAPGDPGEVESGGAGRRTRQLLTLAWFRAWFLFVLRSPGARLRRRADRFEVAMRGADEVDPFLLERVRAERARANRERERKARPFRRSRYVYHRAGCSPSRPLHRGFRRRRAVGE